MSQKQISTTLATGTQRAKKINSVKARIAKVKDFI